MDDKDKLDHKPDDKPEGDKKGYRIVVDATPHYWPTDEISFGEVATIAYPSYPNDHTNPLITYTMNYRNGGGRRPEGKLVEGEKAKIKDGTEFNVTRTDRS